MECLCYNNKTALHYRKDSDIMTDEWIYDKNKTVCFSGHRQEKLPDNGDPWSLKMKTILSMLYFAVHQSIEEGYDTFIVGEPNAEAHIGEIVSDGLGYASTCKTPGKTDGTRRRR